MGIGGRTVRRCRTMRIRRPPARSAAVAASLAACLAGVVAVPASAHGLAPTEPPSPASLLLGWTIEPLVAIGILVVLGWWRWAVRAVDAAHPSNPVPRRRTAAIVGAMVAIAFALMSGIERYDTTLFSIHMLQHILLMLVAAPLIALAAPVTLILRVSSPETRHRWVLPVLHSRVVRFLAHPLVASLIFAVVLWSAHFSPFFDAALEDPLIHDLEHVLFLGSALLFWWPAVALDPAPYRMSHPVRIGYLFMQMTMNTFMAMVILNSGGVLYPHYATVIRPWGTTALEDQKLAAGLMWIAGDLIFIAAILAVVAGWIASEARDASRTDRQAARELAAIRVRERRLAERLADERGDTRPT
jgi:putative copper resistance protein D